MIYAAQFPCGGVVKIGYSKNVAQRIAQLEKTYRSTLYLLAVFDGDMDDERRIHERFAHIRLGRTEQFRATSELMQFLRRPLFVSANPEITEAMPPIGLKPLVASFKGSAEFDTWFSGLADHCRLTASALIEHALVAFAEQRGYKKPPPKR